ncbi:Hypothetical_protein [Hexamita inflata]|uniref:Hypothetical_protein n=1 Tax=Hexamita inflata TaxID=28002 RepID=A0AA86U7G7_9EUKA|nr:Hypothetical protein HINF_LOCUS31739 [Hexamita inflata]
MFKEGMRRLLNIFNQDKFVKSNLLIFLQLLKSTERLWFKIVKITSQRKSNHHKVVFTVINESLAFIGHKEIDIGISQVEKRIVEQNLLEYSQKAAIRHISKQQLE